MATPSTGPGNRVAGGAGVFVGTGAAVGGGGVGVGTGEGVAAGTVGTGLGVDTTVGAGRVGVGTGEGVAVGTVGTGLGVGTTVGAGRVGVGTDEGVAAGTVGTGLGVGTTVGAGRVGVGTGEGVAAGTVGTGPGVGTTVGAGRVGVDAAGLVGTGPDAEAAVGRARVGTGLGDAGIEGFVGDTVEGAAARVSAAAAIVVGEMTVAVGAGLVDRVGNGTRRKSLPPHPANNAVAMISAGISARATGRPDQETWLAALRLVTPFRATGRFSLPTSGWVSWPGFAFNLPPPG